MTTFPKTQAAICSLVLFIAGCGGDGLVNIDGRVAYDGKPIERGTITFFPSDGVGPSAAALIADGEYHVRIASGQKKVQIESLRVVGHHRMMGPTSAMLEDLEQMLPAKYNTKSELHLEVKRGVTNGDFELQK